jgi:protein disulfide-isomerase A1
LVLTDANFHDELKKYDFLLVEFYAPWCGHCKQLAPEYAKAAKRLRENNPPYYIAKVDATENKQVAEEFGIRGFPTLFFFKNGVKMEYGGGRTENEIVSWILKKVGPPSAEITCDAITQKAKDHKLMVVYFGDLTAKDHSQVYTDVTQHGSVSEKFQFFHINDKECAATHGASSTPALVLFRQFDESPLTYSGNWETTPIVDWLLAQSVPTLIEFSEDYIEPIFGQKNSAIFFFRKNEDDSSDFAKVFADASTQLKGKILFVKSSIHDGIQQRLAEFIGVTDDQLPTIRILDPADNMKKFAYSGNARQITVDSIKSFIEEFKGGKLSPFLKSEDIPESNDAPVKVVVGKSFAQIVEDPTKDVLMEYYAPWCGHCKKLAPIYDQLAEDLKDVKDLVIAKMDSTANEVDGVEIRGYPTLKFYPKDSKKNPIDFDGERQLDDFKTWLKEKSTAYKRYLESKAEL